MSQNSNLPTFSFPYYRNPDQLPCHLPTTEEIEAGEIVPTKREIFGGDSGHVVFVGDHFVVKYGPFIRENEGYALLLLEKYPSIPAPRLYAMYREDGVLYMVMELIPGQDLLHLWDGLSEKEKISICGQLREVFAHMRSIPSPGIFGNVIGGPMPHRLFYRRDSDPRVTGPFETLDDFYSGMAHHSRRQHAHNDIHPWSSDWFARHLPRVMKDHPSTFTHCDLVKQNIMVQEQPGVDGETDKQFKVTGIVDWETAGWYPQYWEYAVFFADSLWGDWEEKAETFLDPCPLEAAMIRLFRHDLEGF